MPELLQLNSLTADCQPESVAQACLHPGIVGQLVVIAMLTFVQASQAQIQPMGAHHCIYWALHDSETVHLSQLECERTCPAMDRSVPCVLVDVRCNSIALRSYNPWYEVSAQLCFPGQVR